MPKLPRAAIAGNLATSVTEAAILGVGALAFLAGCTDQESPEAPAPPSVSVQAGPNGDVACQAEQVGDWQLVPSNLNLELIASNLGVSTTHVARGMLGNAVCNPGIPVEEIGAGKVVTVAGAPASMWVSDRCLAIFTDAPPTPGAVAVHVGVVCPAS